MSEYTAMDINSILKKHAAWRYGGSKSGERANLGGANLWGFNLRDADLEGANLWGANLGDANLLGANLAGAELGGANLKGSYLRRANLKGANLVGANLIGANLEDANLRNAYIRGCNGNMVHIKSVFCDKYPVTYTVDVMQIGCQRHPIADWWEFDDKQILEMDGRTALEWWRVWKPILKQIIETAPAKATGYKGEQG